MLRRPYLLRLFSYIVIYNIIYIYIVIITTIPEHESRESISKKMSKRAKRTFRSDILKLGSKIYRLDMIKASKLEMLAVHVTRPFELTFFILATSGFT